MDLQYYVNPDIKLQWTSKMFNILTSLIYCFKHVKHVKTDKTCQMSNAEQYCLHVYCKFQ